MTTAPDKQSEWNDLIEQDIPTVEVESHTQVGEIMNTPTAESPLPLRISDLAFKGYVELWDTWTGRKILQPRWLLWQTVLKKQKDGSQMFSRNDPGIPPNYGADLFCPLNPQDPEYHKLQGMGFKDCPKQHIPHADARMQHLSKSHKRAFAALERDREDRIREEDRQLQRDMLTAMTGAAVKGMAVDVPVQNGAHASVLTATCPDCGLEKTGNSQRRANSKIKLHRPHCKAIKV